MISINFAMGGGRGERGEGRGERGEGRGEGGEGRGEERREKGRDPGGLMIVDCVVSPYFFHDHCNQ